MRRRNGACRREMTVNAVEEPAVSRDDTTGILNTKSTFDR
jgi:hypothetical protein